MKVQGNRYINNPEMIKNKVEKKTTVPQNIISEDDVTNLRKPLWKSMDDAKECNTDTFPLANIHEHQVEFMR